MRKMPRKSHGLYKSHKVRYALLSLGVLAIIVLLAFWYFNRPASKKEATIPSTTSVGSPANNSSGNSNQPSGNGSTSTSAGSSSSSSAPSATTLITPWGNFISNHHPGENGAPTAESSVCNTSAGATCYIKFTNGSLTRTLDNKIANGNGAVIWNWDVKSAGFTAGSWQVSAIASLNGQTKTAVDATLLVIQ